MGLVDLETLKEYLPQYVGTITEKRKGDKYNCPLCNSGKRENGTPAFNLYANNRKCHCHSCGFDGDIIGLYMAVNQMANTRQNYGVAIRALAGMYGLTPIDNAQNNHRQASNQRKEISRRAHIYCTDTGENFAKKTVVSYDNGTKSCYWSLYMPETKRFSGTNLQGRTAPLYHVQNLAQSTDTIYFAEGEKDVERLESWGYTATCMPNGANQTTWHKEYNKYLNQRDIVILCDNDEAGVKYGQTVAKNVHSIAKSVKIIPARAIWSKCPKKWDISDIADKFSDNKARKFLSEAVQKAELYTPPADITQTPEFKAAAERLIRRVTASSPYDVDGTGILTIENLEAYMKEKGYRVYYDEIARRFVYDGFKGESKLHIEENAAFLIYNELQHELKKCTVDKIDAFMRVIATRTRVNPILEKIRGAVWDGKDRLEQVYQMFGMDETDTMSRTLFKKWCMQAISALYNDDENPYSLDIVLVFQGKQGIAKTRFFEHLAMNRMYFGEGYTVDPRNKDSIIEATSNWIVELGEIGSTMRKDIDSLKAFLTKSMDEYRQPFGRKSLKYPRRTVFIGTVNDEKYLIDETGNRRFATIPIKDGISLDYDTQIATFDSLQFWAQIYEIVQAEVECGATIGGCFRLTASEREQLEERNTRFTKPLKGEEEVMDILEKLESSNPNSIEHKLVTVTEFKNYHSVLSKYDSRQIGKVLNKLGIPEVQKKMNGHKVRLRQLPFNKNSIC